MSNVESVRNAIESTYIGSCDIIEHVKSKNEKTKQNEYTEKVAYSQKKCRISFKTISNTNQTTTTNNSTQIVKLFIAPELQIKKGSKIIVTQNGKTIEYKNSGEPAVYETHQEIVLELFDRWS